MYQTISERDFCFKAEYYLIVCRYFEPLGNFTNPAFETGFIFRHLTENRSLSAILKRSQNDYAKCQ